MDSEMDPWKRLKNETPDEGFEHRARRRIVARCARRRVGWWVGAGAALAAAGVAIVLVNEPPRPSPEPQTILAAHDTEAEDEIEQILYEPVLYSEALMDDIFEEVDPEADEGEQSFKVNPNGFTYS